MKNAQYICCPDCGSQILFDPYALVRGTMFSCPTCPNVSIGLDQGSQDIVKKSLDDLDRLKKNTGGIKSD